MPVKSVEAESLSVDERMKRVHNRNCLEVWKEDCQLKHFFSLFNLEKLRDITGFTSAHLGLDWEDICGSPLLVLDFITDFI
ncbi:hypothetical protein TNCV_3039461 [Trichonephila clavipes]|nr:hypothetical protein TNCV_3039461 [Trichonephila clavipes]